VPELIFPKRHKHRDVRSREPLTPPKVDKVRKAAPYRPPWRAQRHDDSPGLPAWLACCCTHAPALGSDRPRSGALARQARHERGPEHAPAHRHSNACLRKLKPLAGDAAYVFLSERQGPLTDSSVRKMIARVGELPGLGFPVHPHQLRHGCGYKLANDQQDTRAIQLFLGHRHIQHTVTYTELPAAQLKDFR